MNQIDNTFIKGMNLDLHPSAIPSDTLITCLNGTTKTNNGNEGILQNDLGNVKLTYAHLPDGYVPLGMREYGGIVYVVSKNPFTNKCLIGSFPSPQQNQDSNDVFVGVTTTAEDIIKDFLYNDLYLVKHTRITKRLCERITEGTAFNIGNYASASATTPTSLMSFPSYVHYNNTAREASIDTIDNSALVILDLGIKNDLGSILKIDSVNGTDNDEFNYLRTSGELYLIEELRLPPNEDFYILDVKKTDAGVELLFDYQGNLSFLTFSPTIDSGGITDVKKGNNHDYYKVTFSNTNDASVKLIRVFIKPSIQYNGNAYKIPLLKLEINIDVDDFSSQFLDDTSLTYLYQYTEFNNNLKINWGLVKAGNIEKVLFNFYLFNKENKTFNTTLSVDDKIVITGKRTFNGFFTNQTSALVPNSLYLVEIQCDYKDNSTPLVYYKWTWTSEIVKQVSGKFLLPLYAELNCDVIDTSNDSNQVTSDNADDGKLNYSKTYKKTINFTYSNLESTYADLEKLPVKPIEISTTSPTLNITYNELNKTLSQSGNFEVNKELATATSITNGIELAATYFAASNSKLVEETYMGRKLKPYLESDEDYNTIFGGFQNEIPKYGIAIGAGSLKSGGVNHCYCFVDFNTWTSGGSVDTIISHFVNLNNVKYKNTSGSDRKWKDVVEPNLQKVYNQELGYYPPIGFIIAPPSSDGRYNGEGRTSELCTMNSDCTTNSTGNKHDYSLILWKDENESYKILRSRHTKKGGYADLIRLFKNLYIMSDNVETYVASKRNVVDIDKYGYTSANTINVKVDVSVNIAEIDNKDDIISGIKDDITSALNRIGKSFTANAVTAMIGLIDVTVTPNNITNTFSKEYSLEILNILPDIQKHLQDDDKDTESSYCVMGNKVITKDDDNANFKEGVIYYKTNNNGLATLNSAKGACDDLDGFDLSVMKNKFTLSKINKKQCIVLKSGLGLSSSPNTVWHNAHAAPYIGRYLSGNPHAETAGNNTSGTYPFPLAAKNYDSYKYLCDFMLKSGNSLW